MVNRVARVHMLDITYSADSLYDYYIPENLREDIKPGAIVSVPFGGSNRRCLALVFELRGKSDYANLKPVFGICDGVCLSGEMLELALFIKEHYFCTIGSAVGLMIPPMALSKASFGKAASAAKTKKLLSFAIPRERALELISAKNGIRGKNQIALIRYMADVSERGGVQIELDEAKKLFSVTAQTISALEKRGVIRVTEVDRFFEPYPEVKKQSGTSNTLSPEQQIAADRLSEFCSCGKAKAALLYGITGSGKTRVIISVIDKTLKNRRQAIVLVPEISLTPQTVGLFKAYYGDRIAVVHSQLSAGERLDMWLRMKRGDMDVCIGTRSAVFAPFENLGLIVIDEEQEHTYKSDMTPKYHARDIARFRCAKNNALMLLASATPSIESFYKAKSGAYTLVELKERYGKAVLPEAVICDMRTETKEGNLTPIGSELRSRLARNLEDRNQSILFINRRGYNNFLSCPLCGNVLSCSRCSVSYTYHVIKGSSGGYLMCHYCGSREAVPEKCPECGNENLRYVGYGTQTVEKEISDCIPGVRISRMDADTTSSKFAYDDIIKDFRAGKADILLGTQMVTKGHDFPNVTMVGVINADSSLYLSDYRSNERTFSLLTQVIGRCGRAEKPGTAVIQTYNPEHPVLKMAAEQEYDKFYENEIASRRALVFPPFCDIALIMLSSKMEDELNVSAREFAERIKQLGKDEFSDVGIVVFGPLEPPVYKINEIFRLQFVIKCRANKRTREFINRLFTEQLKKKSKVSISVDINPNSL